MLYYTFGVISIFSTFFGFVRNLDCTKCNICCFKNSEVKSVVWIALRVSYTFQKHLHLGWPWVGSVLSGFSDLGNPEFCKTKAQNTIHAEIHAEIGYVITCVCMLHFLTRALPLLQGVLLVLITQERTVANFYNVLDDKNSWNPSLATRTWKLLTFCGKLDLLSPDLLGNSFCYLLSPFLQPAEWLSTSITEMAQFNISSISLVLEHPLKYYEFNNTKLC